MFVYLFVCILLINYNAIAHEGHQHGSEPPPPPSLKVPTAALPKVSAVSADFELLGTLQNNVFTLYLDEFATNKPIENATITVSNDELNMVAQRKENGIYLLTTNVFSEAGKYDLVFSIETPQSSDLLISTLIVPEANHRATSDDKKVAATNWFNDVIFLQISLGLMGLLVVLLLWFRGDKKVITMLLVCTVLSFNMPALVFAHGGADHQHAENDVKTDLENSQLNPNKPSRLPNDMVFMPKSVQHLLKLRTIKVKSEEMGEALTLNGHIIADPNTSGFVQAPLRGRLELAEQNIPNLGEKVQKGRVLAYLYPIPESVDRATQQAQIAELDSKVITFTRQLERLKKLGQNVSRKEIDETEAELEGLIKRRKVLQASLNEALPLIAPVSGTVSTRNASAGQIVNAGDTLFSLLDPEKFWVEALIYDPLHTQHIVSATAVTKNEQSLELNFVGTGYQLRSHALPLHFRIKPPLPFLSVSQPVKVFIQMNHTLKGMKVPVNSISKDDNNKSYLWLHQEAEFFKKVIIEAVELTNDFYLVVTGLRDGDRVVTDGASLLAQVR